MDLYLFRHGLAIDREDPGCPPDPDRFLTEKGIRRTRAAARGLAALGVRPTAIWSSPYLRARQTAEIARDALAPEMPIHETDALLYDAGPEEVLAELAGRDRVLLVGHAPHLDRLVAAVLGAEYGWPVRMKKAGAVWLRRPEDDPDDADEARLVGWLDPRPLRRLARRA